MKNYVFLFLLLAGCAKQDVTPTQPRIATAVDSSSIASLKNLSEDPPPLYERTTIVYDPWHSDSALLQLPLEYNSSTEQKFPLVIFFHGVGESAKRGNLSVMNGVAWDILHNNMRIGNVIVLCPQDDDSYRTPQNINGIINIAIARWRVDTTRIYLTGLSSGGRNVYNYLTEKPEYAKRIAAAVPMSSINMDTTHIRHLSYLAEQNVHVQSYCGSSDAKYFNNNKGYVDAINKYKPQLASFIPYAGAHCCWTGLYAIQNQYYNPNVYAWMLQFHK